MSFQQVIIRLYFISLQINCHGKFLFFLFYSLMRHKNPLEIFPYGHPPSPGKLGKLTLSPLENLILSVGVVWIFSATTQSTFHTLSYSLTQDLKSTP